MWATAAGVDDFEAQQRHRLVKSMRLFDLVFFGVATVVSLDTIGYISSFGAQTFTWMLVLVPLFVLPYALLMAEMGGAFVREGGPYHWMRLAWGRGAAALGAVLYWITNPLWLGGSLAFLATEAWSSNLTKIEAGSVWDYVFKLAFIWIGILVAIISLKRGKWIPTIGAFVKIALVAIVCVTVGIYAIEHGVHGCRRGRLLPDARGLPRRRSAADLRHERLRVRDGRGRGDARRPARRAPLDRRLRGRVGRLLPAPDPRDPRRHAREQGLERRGLHGRGRAQLQRLRRRPRACSSTSPRWPSSSPCSPRAPRG